MKPPQAISYTSAYLMQQMLIEELTYPGYEKKSPSPKEKLNSSWDYYFPHYRDSDSMLTTLGDSLLFQAEHTPSIKY